jgi:hypothetical protein
MPTSQARAIQISLPTGCCVSLDRYGPASGNWTGYWGKQGSELIMTRPRQLWQSSRVTCSSTTEWAATTGERSASPRTSGSAPLTTAG